MEYIHNTEQFQFHNTVVALGKFDGMHKGHQLIFDELIKYKEMGYQAAVFSSILNIHLRMNFHIFHQKILLLKFFLKKQE